MSINLIVDIRSREEYFRSYVKGLLNIPLFDLEYYIGFLKDKGVLFCCDSGHRSRMAFEYVDKQGINARATGGKKYGGGQ